jgi:hypothetical protein
MHHRRHAGGEKLPGSRRPWSSRIRVRSEEWRQDGRRDHGDGHRHRRRRVRRGRTQRQTCVPPPSMPRLRGRCAGTQSWKRTSACSLMAGKTAHGRSGPYRRKRANTQCTVEVDRLILSVRSKWPVQAHARILSGGETAHGRSGPYRRKRAKTQCTVEVDRTSARAHSEWRGKPHTVDADRTRAQAPSDSGR